MIKYNSERLFYTGLIWLMMACAAENKPAVQSLENGLISIHMENMDFMVDPTIGARVISAKFGNKEMLLQEREELLNFGATLWPAPQSVWNWPPPHAFQFATYTAEISADRLILKSEPDPKLGLEVEKIFILNSEKNCLEINYRITNNASDTVSVGPWEIVCVPAIGSKVFFPLGYVPEHADTTFTFQNHDGIGWFDFDSEKNLKEHQKLFNNASEGWLAHINEDDGLLFIKTFGKIPAEKLAPGQGNVEVYVSKSFGYIELENHGEFRHLAPGESLEYHVQWYLSELPKTIKSDEMNAELLEHVKSIIN